MKNTVGVVAMMFSFSGYAQGFDRTQDSALPTELPMRTPLFEQEVPELGGLKQKVSADDQKFVTEAFQAGLAEIELGKLAKNVGKSDGVKRFGQKLIDDHSKVNRQLELVAGRIGASLPIQLDESHLAHVRMLSSLRGVEFDTRFAKHMVDGHDKVLTMFYRELKLGQSRDLRDFAQKTIPTLEEHLQIARDLRDGRQFSAL